MGTNTIVAPSLLCNETGNIAVKIFALLLFLWTLVLFYNNFWPQDTGKTLKEE